MYVEVVRNRKSPPTILLRESYRDGGKVKKRTLANLTKEPPEKIEAIRRALRGEALVAPEEAFQIERTFPHGHVAAVLATVRRLGLDRMLAPTGTAQRDRVIALIAARVINPGSKLATARGLRGETASTSLGEILDLQSVSEDDLYAAMDWLLDRQLAIESKLAKKHLQDGTLVLYDVSSSYFEGRCCPLAKLGHNRDGKSGKLQIVYGLLCNRAGCPIAIEVFEGNTGDPSTVASQIDKVRKRFRLQQVVLVGDRGMLTNARIREDIDPVEGLHWITALRGPAIRVLMQQGAIPRSLFDDQNLVEITNTEYPGQRLIVCRNPFLAGDRRRKREELLQSTERHLQKIADAVRRKRRPLRGSDRIGVRVGRTINRFKVGKHFELEITDDSFSYRRKAEQIAEEAALDGLYVVRTDVSKELLDAEETVCAYKGLSTVERAFRSVKTVDLKVRPIHHRLAERVRAHVFLCMLAYYVEWHMRQALAPMLFDDDDREAAQAARSSVVAPAQRSPEALAKASTKRTSDGLPVHSFQTLLADLGTLGLNLVRVGGQRDSTLTRMLTQPTPIQQRALDLLAVGSLL